MARAARILVIDDTPANVKLLADLLTVKGYEVATAPNGEEGLKRLAEQRPDLVLLDVMMPGLNGYEVCRAIRADPSTGVLPVVMVTSLDPAQERIKGLEAGADDFLSKPINQAELLARVKSLLRIKSLYDQLGELNASLEQRVAEQVASLERFARLKRFVSPRIGDLILSGEVDDPLRTHRREITVVFTDLRGFTTFSETAEPEEAMDVLRAYHGELGRIVLAHEGTIEHFAGDGVMILFNDPIPVDAHELAAIRMALEMRQAVGALGTGWKKRGYELGFGVGIANGYATLGAIGFEGRRDYGAIGPVTNLSARLCSEAKAGQILISQRLYGKVDERLQAESVGELSLKGIQRAVSAYNVVGLRD
ncbi:MAG: adenylate/guanylate cyclase domain-containing response regulator [Betaproteobacteria bacterium]|nr:MAG: adenylate/guanylate cyclase domain-containing response regulator [Betaproteobacteria bacterium]